MQEAMVALHSGLKGKAEDILLRLVAEHPDHADAWLNLANLAVLGKRSDTALERFQKVLDLSPNQPEALLWTGVLQSHKGMFGSAISYLEAADKAKPRDVQTLLPLAQCRFQLGQITGAIEAYTIALELMPGNPDLLFSRATCMLEQLRFKEAQADLSSALQRKQIPMGFALLGEIHQRFGRSSEALSQAERALRLDPKNTQALSTAANALAAMGRLDEAEQIWARAERGAVKPARLLNAKAKSYLDLGHFDRAREILLRSIEIDPKFGETYYSYLSCKRTSREDLPILAKLEVQLACSDVRAQDREFLLYALGKSQTDLGEFQASLKSFDEANALKLKTSGAKQFDRDRFKAYFEGQRSIYSAEAIRQMQGDGSKSDVPIFVLGMMRSGTSLMEQILSCHPNIGGAGEQAFWHEHESEWRNSFSSLSCRYLALLESAAPGFAKIIDKNPANAMLAGLLAIAFPKGKILNMRRHPVDTALSIWMTPMRTTAPFIGTRSDIVFAYQQYARLSQHWEEAIPSNQFRAISYEELVGNPEAVIQDAVEFCGVDWDPVCLHPENNSRPVLTPSFWQVRQPLYRGSTNRWKQYSPWLGEFERLMP